MTPLLALLLAAVAPGSSPTPVVPRAEPGAVGVVGAVGASDPAAGAESREQESPEPGLTAIQRVSEQIVRAASEQRPPASTAVAVHVTSAETPELGRAVQTVLVSRLTRAGFKRVLPIKDASAVAAEERARELAADILVRLTVRLDGAELALGGDLAPTWVNFWAGSDPVRAPGGAALTARALTDAEALTLAHVPLLQSPDSAKVATRFELAPLGSAPERIVALAAGDLDADGAPEIAALGVESVLVLRADGSLVARRSHAKLPLAARPPREPFGAIAIGPFGAERPHVAAFFAEREAGELLEPREGALVPARPVATLPLCNGAAGALIGSPVPGRGEIDAASVAFAESGGKAELAFSPVSVVASARAAGPAFLAIGADGSGVLLDADLSPIERKLPELGSAAAMGDLDGDGATDIVITRRVLAGDSVRVVREDDPAADLYSSEPFAGAITAAVAVDLDGDGRDEAVLAHLEPDGTTTFHVLGGEP